MHFFILKVHAYKIIFHDYDPVVRRSERLSCLKKDNTLRKYLQLQLNTKCANEHIQQQDGTFSSLGKKKKTTKTALIYCWYFSVARRPPCCICLWPDQLGHTADCTGALQTGWYQSGFLPSGSQTGGRIPPGLG